MTSILDMKAPDNGWTQITNFFLPLKYLITTDRFDAFMQYVDFNYLANAMFWIFILYSATYAVFSKIFQFVLKSSSIKYYRRKQFLRSFWNIAFYAACVLFLYFYNEFMILPLLSKNQGRYSLFYSSENLIFYRSHQCEKFQLYSLFILTFQLHGAILDFKESDFLEAASKALYLLAMVAIDFYRYENYFVGLNLSLGIHNIITECLFLLALQSSSRSRLIYQVFLGLRIASWSHVFINVLPFQYLVPTLFAKNFKLSLNVLIWLWYGLSIWNSPVLQYFYHQIYHNTPLDCSGEGSASKCIMLKDSSDHRHYKTLKKAYLELKLSMTPETPTGNSSAKAFQAIKCIMTMKRKLKRIRKERGTDVEEETEELQPSSSSSASTSPLSSPSAYPQYKDF